MAQRLVRTDPGVSATGLVDADEATAKHFKDAAGRLGRWLPQCVAKALDKYGKGGGLVDGELVREFGDRPHHVDVRQILKTAHLPLRERALSADVHHLCERAVYYAPPRLAHPAAVVDLLVVEQGMSIAEAKALDKYGKGGGLVDGELVREFPIRRNSDHRNAA